MKKLLKWGAIAFVIIIVLGAIAGGDDDSSTTRPTNSNSNTKEAKSTDKGIKTYGMNEDAVVGDVRWNVSKAYTSKTLQGFMETKTAGGQYVVVNVTVENLGKEMKSVSDLKVVDSQGREFTASSDMFKNLGAEQMYILDNINPNVPQTFAAVYEVPEGAEGLKLMVGDLSLLGSDEALIDLEL